MEIKFLYRFCLNGAGSVVGERETCTNEGRFIITWLSCSAGQKGTLSDTLRRLLQKTCGNSNWKEDDFGTHHSGGLVKRKGCADGPFS